MLLFSCRIGEEKKHEHKDPIHIVTTTGIIENVVEEIVGDSADVSALMGPGTDPHIYKPTPRDVELLDEADVIIANGLHLEGKMSEMLKKYGKEKPVLFVSDGIAPSKLIKSADAGDAVDPHIWFDPEIWMEGMKHIAKELGKIDSTSAGYYLENWKDYNDQVIATTEWVNEQFDSLDADQRILVTSHDAFSYFGRKFNIEVRGIQGISTLSEVGLQDIANMVDFVVEKKLKSIFVETSTSDKTAQSIVDGCRDKNYEVQLSGPLYSDALGEPDSEAGTYLGMIRTNVTTIVEGLK